MTDTVAFYTALPVMRGFKTLMNSARYTPLPQDWAVGIADVVESTKPIAAKRYKAMNMAGAAVATALKAAAG